MPLVPNFVERLILLRLNQGPGSLLDLLGAGAFRVVTSALEFGIFDALSQGPLTVSELSQRTGTDERGMGLLLAALEAFGYVQKTASRYANTPLTAKWLLGTSPAHLADFLTWWQRLVFEFWDEYFEESLRNGRPPLTIYEWLASQPDGWKTAQAGLEATARMALDDVIARIDFPQNGRRVLDVGGGHGLYTIELCRRNPELTATIFDLPVALERARENSHASGLNDRVSLLPGDYREDDLGHGYDLALLFNIIHGHRPEENVHLLKKVAAALAPNGRVVILDLMGDKAFGPALRAANSLFALTYFILLGGQTFTYQEVEKWLRQAGFAIVSRKSLLKAPGAIMITAAREG